MNLYLSTLNFGVWSAPKVYFRGSGQILMVIFVKLHKNSLSGMHLSFVTIWPSYLHVLPAVAVYYDSYIMQ